MRYSVRALLISTLVPPLLLLAACGGGDKKSTAAPTSAPSGSSGAASIPAANNASPNNAAPSGFDLTKSTTTPSGLKYIDSVVGTGDSPRMDQTVMVNYTGKLAADGKVFDSTTGRGPASFALTRVIKGFAEGISTMKAGGKRTVLIPAALGYGANPPPGSGIPANADLIFDIELISFK